MKLRHAFYGLEQIISVSILASLFFCFIMLFYTVHVPTNCDFDTRNVSSISGTILPVTFTYNFVKTTMIAMTCICIYLVMWRYAIHTCMIYMLDASIDPFYEYLLDPAYLTVPISDTPLVLNTCVSSVEPLYQIVVCETLCQGQCGLLVLVDHCYEALISNTSRLKL